MHGVLAAMGLYSSAPSGGHRRDWWRQVGTDGRSLVESGGLGMQQQQLLHTTAKLVATLPVTMDVTELGVWRSTVGGLGRGRSSTGRLKRRGSACNKVRRGRSTIGRFESYGPRL
ncbi:hypothetical protein DAI22_09g004500 [Oryza sativa Japonica Group]|nr:hypothetical protein DAI22_09g004500 [Oryza sativa Japonica Group]